MRRPGLNRPAGAAYPRRLHRIATLLLAFASASSAPVPPPLTGSPAARGEWVARQADARDAGRDARSALRMRLHDRRGRVRERRLEMLRLAAGAPRPPGAAGDRLLVRFTYPEDIRGTGLLVWERAAGEDERFLYLPSLGRVRRIAGVEAQESFAGSDFTHEDIGGRELDDYGYTLLDEASAWVAADGTRRPAYRLESRRKDTSARYPRVVSLVLADSFVVVRAEIHNRRHEPEKTYEVRRLEQVEAIWTVLEASMANQVDGTRTELLVDKIDYNVGLTVADLDRDELERGGR